MLGAQTRAAEYHAAKKASARQASREAEEQKLPLTAAPISLGAFTRTAQTSRNQGKKTYVPLVLEQTPEATSESTPDVSETPTKKPPMSSSEDTSSVGSSSITQSRTRSANPPTMPRAMIYSATVPGGPANNITPRSTRPHTLPGFNRPMSMPPPQYMQPNVHPYSADHVFHRPATDIPWPHMPMVHHRPYHVDHQPHYLHPCAATFENHTPLTSHVALSEPETDGQEYAENQPRSPRTRTTQNAQNCFIFGPDDISPSKQELKTSTRKHMITEIEPRADDVVFGPQSDFERPVLNPIRLRDPSLEAESCRADANDGPDHNMASVPPAIRPLLVRFHESDSASASSLQPVLLPNPLRRYTNTEFISDPPVTAIPWSKPRGPEENFPRDEDDQEHYDRCSKMEKFVAVQQVLSRKGKTVLNNPERKTSSTVVPSSTCSGNEGGPGPSMPEGEARYLHPVRHHSTGCVPPAFDKPEQPLKPSPTTVKYDFSCFSSSDIALQQSFGVMNDEWFDLKPVSIYDRQKLQAAMKQIRNKDACIEPRLLRDSQLHGSQEAAKWMHTDPRRFQTARQRNNVLAKGYSLRLRLAPDYDHSGDGHIDVHAGMVRAAGHMLANLSEYIVEDKSRPDYFNRTKPVPEHAVDRGVFSNTSDGTSLFEAKENVVLGSCSRSTGDSTFSRGMKEALISRHGDSDLYNQKYVWDEKTTAWAL